MGGLFGSTSPQQITPQPVETIDQAAQQEDQADKIRRRRGVGSTVLVPNNPALGLGPGSTPGMPPAVTKLGQAA